MSKEEKEILFKDLCARLPYGIKVKCGDTVTKEICDLVGINAEISSVSIRDIWAKYYLENVSSIKPYLRPMSSMTEEEIKEYKHLVAFSGNPEGSAKLVDWLNKKKFAYRTIDGKDMFELGLAFEALEGMYK